MYKQAPMPLAFTPSHNACVASATNIVTGNLGKVRMQAFSHDSEHLAKTLAHWKKMKVENVLVTPASTSENETTRLEENEQIALFNNEQGIATTQENAPVKKVKTVTKKVAAKIAVPTPEPTKIVETIEVATIETTTEKEETTMTTTQVLTSAQNDDVTTTMPTMSDEKTLTCPTVQSMSDIALSLKNASQDDMDALQLRDVPMLGTSFAAMEATDVAWLWDNYLPLKPILLTGEPGTRKSMLASYIAAIVSTGGIWPDGTKCDRGNVLIINEEDDDSDTTCKRLMHFGADLSRVFSLNEVVDDKVQLHANTTMPFSLPRHMNLLEQTIIAREITFVVFDPMLKICGASGKKEATCGPTIMQPLTKMCDRHGVAMLMINHFKNGIYNQNNVLTAIEGAFHNSVRMSYTAMLDSETGCTVLKQLKNNVGPTMQPLSYRLVKDRNGVLGLDFPLGRNTTLLEKIDAHAKSTLKTKIIALIAYRGYGLTPSAVAQQLDINAGSIRTEMRRMIASQELQQNEHGEYELGPNA